MRLRDFFDRWVRWRCCDCPYPHGGYSFWRCGKRRGHKGRHRMRNYTWSDDGRTRFEPLPIDVKLKDIGVSDLIR